MSCAVWRLIGADCALLKKMAQLIPPEHIYYFGHITNFCLKVSDEDTLITFNEQWDNIYYHYYYYYVYWQWRVAAWGLNRQMVFCMLRSTKQYWLLCFAFLFSLICLTYYDLFSSNPLSKVTNSGKISVSPYIISSEWILCCVAINFCIFPKNKRDTLYGQF